MFVMKEYMPEMLADMMEFALQVYHKSREEYNEYCLRPDAVIAGDFKPIVDYNIGDRYITLGGGGSVTKTFKRPYRGKMVRIKARGLLPLETTPEHPVLVVTGRRVHISNKGDSYEDNYKYEWYGPYWKLAKNITPKYKDRAGDYLVVPRLKGCVNIRSLSLKKYTTPSRIKYCDRIGFPLTYKLNRDGAWLLGLYVAEGYARDELVFCLGKHEIDVIQDAYDVIDRLGFRYHLVHSGPETLVHIGSKILSKAFKEWCGKGAENKRVPSFILFHNDLDILRWFLIGYLTGDGFVRTKRREEINAVTISKRLALQLQLLCARLGFLLCVYSLGKGSGRIKGRVVRRRNQFRLYVPKEHRFIRVFDDYILTPVKSVTRTSYQGFVYNLKTEHGTYLVSNAVVHNCEMAREHTRAWDYRKVYPRLLRHLGIDRHGR